MLLGQHVVLVRSNKRSQEDKLSMFSFLAVDWGFN